MVGILSFDAFNEQGHTQKKYKNPQFLFELPIADQSCLVKK